MKIKKEEVKLYDIVIKLNNVETEFLITALEKCLQNGFIVGSHREFYTELHEKLKSAVKEEKVFICKSRD